MNWTTEPGSEQYHMQHITYLKAKVREARMHETLPVVIYFFYVVQKHKASVSREFRAVQFLFFCERARERGNWMRLMNRNIFHNWTQSRGNMLIVFGAWTRLSSNEKNQSAKCAMTFLLFQAAALERATFICCCTKSKIAECTHKKRSKKEIKIIYDISQFVQLHTENSKSFFVLCEA